MSITIKYIAELAGTSIATVSRVISNDSRISERTRSKIIKIIVQHGYQPNLFAKGLASKLSYNIGVLLPNPAKNVNIHSLKAVRGIISQAKHHGYNVLLLTGNSEQDVLQSIESRYKGRSMDGLILFYTSDRDDVISYLNLSGIPFVLIGRNMKHADIHAVDYDQFQAAWDATHFLVQLNHQNIAILHGPEHVTIQSDRMKGYQLALQSSRIEPNPDWCIVVEKDEEDIIVWTWINSPERPTAIIVQDDDTALKVVRALAKLKLKVPDDVSIVSFSQDTMGELVSPSLTAVHTDSYSHGYEAASMLLQLLKGTRIESNRKILPHGIKVRESTRRID
ncbi:DNA-binding LacI/PurR family transcriptional regulator [Paenibacillus endophyticus]|uniref:DNA-binding LacI/PurR family transcriptional regulator n=1 Tax=Paenibacillus endophyticus TaxID=1294268 RepID=A0A7W5CCE3_9BACL|nr:LacI family DNA-binding transcriptional regulator [Paenibacillus endophyticus]MBB3155136.1 DNA-binding LacI/PurR family transcriptional regulator [Paenibacillus endophyticus]